MGCDAVDKGVSMCGADILGPGMEHSGTEDGAESRKQNRMRSSLSCCFILLAILTGCPGSG